jgi:acetyl esterase/lipase
MLAAAGGATIASATSVAHAEQAMSAVEPDMMLWPDAAIAAEQVLAPVPPDRRFPPAYRHLVDVARPVLTPYRPSRPNGAAILICPGGGYAIVGRSAGLCRWFADRGFWVFDLLYRLPGGGWRAGPDAPLQDAQQGIRLVRARARELGIDSTRIGIAGFSAGGHLAASAATRFEADLEPPSRELAAVSARPDFALLACPVVTMRTPYRHEASARALFRGAAPDRARVDALSPELHVTARTPPCFLAHAADDRVVSPQNSMLLFNALRERRVVTELHIFSAGGHDMGQGFRPDTPVSAYPQLFLQWLAREKLAAPGAPKG